MLLLAFALTPLVTVLAAQINYDNLLLLAVTTCLYLAVSFLQQLSKGVFDARSLLILLVVCLFSSFIKFAFLPVFAALAGVITWAIVRHGTMATARKFCPHGWRHTSGIAACVHKRKSSVRTVLRG